MISASPKIVLERLTEEWSEAMTDASLFSELEFEKQLWMLAALQPPDKKMLSRTVINDQKVDPSQCGGRKILSLYEDHGKLCGHASQCIPSIPQMRGFVTIVRLRAYSPLNY
jgi:hypothetical protein